MRKLLTILFLIPAFAFGQIVITEKCTMQATSTNALAFGCGPTTFDQNKLYIFIGITTGTTNAGTIASTTLTWTSMVSIGNSTSRIQLFRCVPSSNVASETVTLGTFGSSTSGYFGGVYEITGTVITGTNGADAIVQLVSQTATTGANPTINLAALTGSNNTVIGMFTNGVNPFGATPESGWTEVYDLGYAIPDAGYYETRRATTTDNTVQITSASSTWSGVAFELQALPTRRIFNIQ